VLEGTSGASRVLVVAARPIGEPIAKHGPFVMNTVDELRQAVSDYQRGLI
jgi:redox-sensitive bicupin YhaK (pirin superfamily)